MLRKLGLMAIVMSFAATAMADDSTLKVKEGDAFPKFELTAAQVEKIPGKKAGEKVSLADLKGKNVVIFFYPKALTSGCTIESCGFRDCAEKFPKDAILIGASADTEEKQKEFIEKHKLPYALLCDTELKLIQALGIQSMKGKVPQRISFVIDKEGKISKIYTKVSPKDHPEEVLKYVNALGK
ncbi:MAG: peroxiredoxin [Fimbriiglobus sp.]